MKYLSPTISGTCEPSYVRRVVVEEVLITRKGVRTYIISNSKTIIFEATDTKVLRKRAYPSWQAGREALLSRPVSCGTARCSEVRTRSLRDKPGNA